MDIHFLQQPLRAFVDFCLSALGDGLSGLGGIDPPIVVDQD